MRATLVVVCISLGGCGLAGPSAPFKAEAEGVAVFEGPAPRAQCAPGDLTEGGLQGQVPPADRLSGRSTLNPYNLA